MPKQMGKFNGALNVLAIAGLVVGREVRVDVPASNRLWIPPLWYDEHNDYGGGIVANFNTPSAVMIRFSEDDKPSGPWGSVVGYRNSQNGEFNAIYVTLINYEPTHPMFICFGTDIDGGFVGVNAPWIGC